MSDTAMELAPCSAAVEPSCPWPLHVGDLCIHHYRQRCKEQSLGRDWVAKPIQRKPGEPVRPQHRMKAHNLPPISAKGVWTRCMHDQGEACSAQAVGESAFCPAHQRPPPKRASRDVGPESERTVTPQRHRTCDISDCAERVILGQTHCDRHRAILERRTSFGRGGGLVSATDSSSRVAEIPSVAEAPSATAPAWKRSEERLAAAPYVAIASPATRRRYPDTCSAAGCTKATAASGLCVGHLSQRRNWAGEGAWVATPLRAPQGPRLVAPPVVANPEPLAIVEADVVGVGVAVDDTPAPAAPPVATRVEEQFAVLGLTQWKPRSLRSTPPIPTAPATAPSPNTTREEPMAEKHCKRCTTKKLRIDNTSGFCSDCRYKLGSPTSDQIEAAWAAEKAGASPSSARRDAPAPPTKPKAKPGPKARPEFTKATFPQLEDVSTEELLAEVARRFEVQAEQLEQATTFRKRAAELLADAAA